MQVCGRIYYVARHGFRDTRQVVTIQDQHTTFKENFDEFDDQGNARHKRETLEALWVTLNTYRSVCHDLNPGCGGIIRDNSGRWLGYFTKRLGKFKVRNIEFYGVLEGKKLAHMKKFDRMGIQVDSTEVYKAIKMENYHMGQTLVC